MEQLKAFSKLALKNLYLQMAQSRKLTLMEPKLLFILMDRQTSCFRTAAESESMRMAVLKRRSGSETKYEK